MCPWSGPVHPAAQVAIVSGPEGEVEVVRHEAVSQNSHRDTKRRLGHDLEKRLIVVGLVEHLGACVAAIEDMVCVSADRTTSCTRHRPPEGARLESEFDPT